MSSVCILTDSTAQFSKPSFPGDNLVHVIPLKVSMTDQQEYDSVEMRVKLLPSTIKNGFGPEVAVPSGQEMRQIFTDLGASYNEIIAIFMSSHLTSLVETAQEAAAAVRGRVSIQVIDSQTISIGLGVLVQLAAEAASQYASSTEIERIVRGIIPHIYTVFCIPGLSYLSHTGLIGKSQAIVGEMLGIYPIYTLEEGHLSPLEKARNTRQLMDFFQEFLDEFCDLYHISYIQSCPAMLHEARQIRDHVNASFSKTPFSEHPINLSLASLFGPRSSGLFAIEIPEED